VPGALQPRLRTQRPGTRLRDPWTRICRARTRQWGSWPRRAATGCERPAQRLCGRWAGRWRARPRREPTRHHRHTQQPCRSRVRGPLGHGSLPLPQWYRPGRRRGRRKPRRQWPPHRWLTARRHRPTPGPGERRAHRPRCRAQRFRGRGQRASLPTAGPGRLARPARKPGRHSARRHRLAAGPTEHRQQRCGHARPRCALGADILGHDRGPHAQPLAPPDRRRPCRAEGHRDGPNRLGGRRARQRRMGQPHGPPRRRLHHHQRPLATATQAVGRQRWPPSPRTGADRWSRSG
jgi:hypothetical protein